YTSYLKRYLCLVSNYNLAGSPHPAISPQVPALQSLPQGVVPLSWVNYFAGGVTGHWLLILFRWHSVIHRLFMKRNLDTHTRTRARTQNSLYRKPSCSLPPRATCSWKRTGFPLGRMECSTKGQLALLPSSKRNS
ncbi:mCG1030587, partial [Mus musculus]